LIVPVLAASTAAAVPARGPGGRNGGDRVCQPDRLGDGVRRNRLGHVCCSVKDFRLQPGAPWFFWSDFIWSRPGAKANSGTACRSRGTAKPRPSSTSRQARQATDGVHPADGQSSGLILSGPRGPLHRPVFFWTMLARSRMRPPASTSLIRSATKSHARSLLSIAKLKRARSRPWPPISSLTRMAQTSFGLSAASDQ
jgi:hypothetical protein